MRTRQLLWSCVTCNYFYNWAATQQRYHLHYFCVIKEAIHFYVIYFSNCVLVQLCFCVLILIMDTCGVFLNCLSNMYIEILKSYMRLTWLSLTDLCWWIINIVKISFSNSGRCCLAWPKSARWSQTVHCRGVFGSANGEWAARWLEGWWCGCSGLLNYNCSISSC